ncbi:MAG: carbohydrate porin [Gemmatimonadetes bacterium]|nr:carbohydrate porin [Gemmatimonadota bacterium]
MALTRYAVAGAALLAVHATAAAQGGVCDRPTVRALGAQATFIGQRLSPFHSPYQGAMSLDAAGDRQLSQSYGAYGGACLGGDVELYVDGEMVRGAGISHASGIAGVTNGDVLRQGSVDLGDAPYVARAFVRWRHGLGGPARDTLARAMDELEGTVPSRRVEVTAGKFALSDFLDVNRYANSTRLQFLDWALFQNTSWDFAADTRGYTYGVAFAWITPAWSLRAASAQMPRFANGNVFDGDLRLARGDNVELSLAVPGDGVVRLMAWRNTARMGRYDAANALATATRPPNIVADDAPGRTKWGLAANAELPLADKGETGAFARAGWSDGANESFAFSEVDEHLSAGLQLAGARWGRTDDRAGIAFVLHGISDAHRRYLALGGNGFLLGDGALRYGPEGIVESYYRVQVGPWLQLSPDVMLIANPGYNRDRGPAFVTTLRLSTHW